MLLRHNMAAAAAVQRATVGLWVEVHTFEETAKLHEKKSNSIIAQNISSDLALAGSSSGATWPPLAAVVVQTATAVQLLQDMRARRQDERAKPELELQWLRLVVLN